MFMCSPMHTSSFPRCALCIRPLSLVSAPLFASFPLRQGCVDGGGLWRMFHLTTEKTRHMCCVLLVSYTAVVCSYIASLVTCCSIAFSHCPSSRRYAS
ncbi:uncharacterized protein SCHCODRAFT_02293324 [Schizophyllum commune H4-8]|uniref:uncharacterized protein n=1 Tax=Schizophyllum commune (strain H4-8 / FGSC 9210) TaxID=578458 RepID=UPI00215E8CB6|nr:uncharacterized protein SCHCODRAFT_02293324 [Schizophyllum commune H4-8]KAI5892508.1 hypothetical protein SCHCODRAFT_02293324 [Schizophyllum commune H4-8]